MPRIHVQVELRCNILLWLHALYSVLLHLPAALQDIFHLHFMAREGATLAPVAADTISEGSSTQLPSTYRGPLITK